MATKRQVRALGDITRELDLVVFQLERDVPDAEVQRRKLRRELERLRDQLADVVRELE